MEAIMEKKIIIRGSEATVQEKEQERKFIEKELIRDKIFKIENDLKKLDVKTMKFIDGELTEEEYKIFKNQKIELRKEYRIQEQLYKEFDN
jgi:hypothetical protein